MQKEYLRQTVQINLGQQVRSIYHIYAAFESSVLLIASEQAESVNLYHIKQHGDIHKICQISPDEQQRPCRPLAMLDCKTVAVINAQNKFITIICLQTYNKRRIQTKQRNWFDGSIFYFEESRLICTANYYKGTVNYYQLNGNNLKQFVGNREYEQQHEYKYYKGDYRSLVIEGEHNQHSKLIKIHLYRVENEQLFMSINVSSAILFLQDTTNIWLTNSNHLWLTGLRQKNAKVLSLNFQPLSLNICDNIVSSEKEVKQLKGINTGNSSVFFIKNELSYNFVIVNNENDSIACQSEMHLEGLLYFYAPDNQKDVIVMPQFHTENNSIRITTIRMAFTCAEIYLHSLVQINENFDEGLLQDAVQLLGK